MNTFDEYNGRIMMRGQFSDTLSMLWMQMFEYLINFSKKLGNARELESLLWPFTAGLLLLWDGCLFYFVLLRKKNHFFMVIFMAQIEWGKMMCISRKFMWIGFVVKLCSYFYCCNEKNLTCFFVFFLVWQKISNKIFNSAFFSRHQLSNSWLGFKEYTNENFKRKIWKGNFVSLFCKRNYWNIQKFLFTDWM